MLTVIILEISVCHQIHERDKDTDFCMLVVRKLLRTNSKNVKVSTYGYSIAIIVLHVCGIGLKKMWPLTHELQCNYIDSFRVLSLCRWFWCLPLSIRLPTPVTLPLGCPEGWSQHQPSPCRDAPTGSLTSALTTSNMSERYAKFCEIMQTFFKLGKHRRLDC